VRYLLDTGRSTRPRAWPAADSLAFSNAPIPSNTMVDFRLRLLTGRVF
jgi:hypothetical protein